MTTPFERVAFQRLPKFSARNASSRRIFHRKLNLVNVSFENNESISMSICGHLSGSYFQLIILASFLQLYGCAFYNSTIFVSNFDVEQALKSRISQRKRKQLSDCNYVSVVHKVSRGFASDVEIAFHDFPAVVARI